MTARRSLCTMKMTLFRKALLLDNFTLLSFFQILRWSFPKPRFYCHRYVRVRGTRPRA